MRVIEPGVEPGFVFLHGVNVLRFDADSRLARHNPHAERVGLPEIFETRHEIFSPQTVGQIAHLTHSVLLAPNQLPIARPPPRPDIPIADAEWLRRPQSRQARAIRLAW